MNPKQIKWTLEKCNNLIGLAKYPLTEEVSQRIKDTAEIYFKESKENPEFKLAVVNTLGFIDNIDRAYRLYEEEMGDFK